MKKKKLLKRVQDIKDFIGIYDGYIDEKLCKEILNLFPKGSVNINKIKAIDPNKKFDYLKSNDNLEKAEKRTLKKTAKND